MSHVRVSFITTFGMDRIWLPVGWAMSTVLIQSPWCMREEYQVLQWPPCLCGRRQPTNQPLDLGVVERHSHSTPEIHAQAGKFSEYRCSPGSAVQVSSSVETLFCPVEMTAPTSGETSIGRDQRCIGLLIFIPCIWWWCFWWKVSAPLRPGISAESEWSWGTTRYRGFLSHVPSCPFDPSHPQFPCCDKFASQQPKKKYYRPFTEVPPALYHTESPPKCVAGSGWTSLTKEFECTAPKGDWSTWTGRSTEWERYWRQTFGSTRNANATIGSTCTFAPPGQRSSQSRAGGLCAGSPRPQWCGLVGDRGQVTRYVYQSTRL